LPPGSPGRGPVGQTAQVNELAITVVGRDRPGIIADVSGVLAGLGLNLTDSTMTLLRGHFAMTLICVGRPTVRAVPAEEAGGAGGVPYTLLVHGADRLGIVAAVTEVLAAAGGNITDLTTRLSGSLYLLSAEVDLPSTVDIDELVTRLDDVAQRLGVEVSLREAEADVL
jgi:glycine cleavage system transcriptional repressor